MGCTRTKRSDLLGALPGFGPLDLFAQPACLASLAPACAPQSSTALALAFARPCAPTTPSTPLLLVGAGFGRALGKLAAAVASTLAPRRCRAACFAVGLAVSGWALALPGTLSDALFALGYGSPLSLAPCRASSRSGAACSPASTFLGRPASPVSRTFGPGKAMTCGTPVRRPGGNVDVGDREVWDCEIIRVLNSGSVDGVCSRRRTVVVVGIQGSRSREHR